MKQQSQYFQSFQGEYKHLRLQLTFSSSTSSLSIIVQNTENFQLFQQTINKAYLLSHQQCKKFLFTPQEIFQYFTNQFDIIIIQSGIIVIPYGIDEKIEIKLIKEEIEPLVLARVQIEEMKKQFMIQLKKSIHGVREKLAALMGSEEEKKEEAQEYNELNLARIEETNNQSGMLGNTCLLDYTQFTEKRFGNNPQNPHRKHFLMTIKNSKETLKMIQNLSKWLIFCQQISYSTNLSPSPFPSISHSVELKKITDQHLMIGLCTKDLFGTENTFTKRHSMYYSCQGVIYANGSKIMEAKLSKNGDVVDCLVDLKNKRILWIKNKSMIARYRRGCKVFCCTSP